MTLNHNCGCFSGVGGIAGNVLRLGEGCLTDAQISHKTLWQLLPNRCYLLGGLSVGT